MKTRVAVTSIDCYYAIRSEGRLGTQQARIMDEIRQGRDYSLQELVKLTGLQINAVAGRVNELKEMKALEVSTPRKCSVTQRTVRPVRLPVKKAELPLQ